MEADLKHLELRLSNLLWNKRTLQEYLRGKEWCREHNELEVVNSEYNTLTTEFHSKLKQFLFAKFNNLLPKELTNLICELVYVNEF